ncbi:MAG: DUF2934 domain-containing protein [Verrucomicrobiota bacterium]
MIDNALTEDQIRNRAYQIYLEHGQQPQHDLDNWIQAEYELLRLPIQQITKLETQRHKLSRRSLVSLIQTAVLLGAGSLIQLKTGLSVKINNKLLQAKLLKTKAYEVYVRQGRQAGQELDNWLQAENETGTSLSRSFQNMLQSLPLESSLQPASSE